jgi:quinolinate synthase
MDLAAKILELKQKKNAVILAHYYQVPEIQDIADFIGDSLGLAQRTSKSKADIIVFAGVHFMAETAKILNPKTKVILPDFHAGCSLADSCQPDDFRKFIQKNPGHTVISYINCSAAIKAMSDVICTSSNAISIVESFPEAEKIIFAPDRNLGNYINHVTGRNMILWNGTCSVHDILRSERIIELKIQNPRAKLLAHPECKAPVLELADFIGSTTAMLNYTKTDTAIKYIIATETGIVHQMIKASPHKEFIVASPDETCACNDCPYMKMNTMEKLYHCLKNEKPEIVIPDEIMEKARRPIQRMMELSKNLKLVS